MKDIVSLIYGDSIVYGIGDQEYFGWVNRVKFNLENNKNNYIFNLGIPGQNSTDILNRFENELKSRFNKEDVFNLIFSFGIKDTLLYNEDKNYLNVFKDNIKNIISISKKYSKNIYFIGLIIPDISIRTNYNIDNVLLFDNELENICNENSVNYIRIRDLINKDDLFDGLHPNNNGHKKISEFIIQNIFEN